MQPMFNFPMELVSNEQGTPQGMTVLQSRASGSRRGGHVVVLGFAASPLPVPADEVSDRALVRMIKGGKVAPTQRIRLEMN